MKQRCLFYLFLIIIIFPARNYAQLICGFDKLHRQKLAADPAYRQFISSFEEKLRKIKDAGTGNLRPEGFTDTIPVVIHIIHTGDIVGSRYNPTDAQIQETIDYTNQVYAGTYPGMSGAGDIGIRFVLAKRDPYCNPTTGIDRVDGRILPLYETNGISYEGDETIGVSTNQLMKLVKWNPNHYYNIWLVNSISTRQLYNALAGYAYFPTTAEQDGAVIRAQSIFAGSFVLPHELGHAFFLYHTFEGSARATCPINNECSTEGDQVCDTDPVTEAFGEGRTGINSCTNTPYSDNTEKNFMSYTCCASLFTEGQRTRMQQTALISPVRDSLSKSTGRFPADASTTCGFTLRLDGKLTGNDILLYWQGDYANANSYDLERSYDGVTFTYIARIANQQGIKNYGFNDPDIPQQKNYYRLKQFGDGGIVNYSNTVVINLPINSDLALHVLNNPVSNYIDMEIGFFRDGQGNILPGYYGEASVRLLDMSGRMLISRQQTVTINQRLRIDVNNIPPAVYVLQVIINNVVYAKKILKM